MPNNLAIGPVAVGPMNRPLLDDVGPSNAKPLQVRLGGQTFSGSNDNGHVSLSGPGGKALDFYMSPNGRVDRGSVLSNMGRKEAAALIKGAGGWLPATRPANRSAVTPQGVQNAINNMQQQLNSIDPASSDVGNAIRSVSDQLKDLKQQLQGVPQGSTTKDLLSQIEQLGEQIKEIVRKLGGTPVDAPQTNQQTSPEQPAADSKVAEKTEKKGGGLFGGLLSFVGKVVPGPIGLVADAASKIIS